MEFGKQSPGRFHQIVFFSLVPHGKLWIFRHGPHWPVVLVIDRGFDALESRRLGRLWLFVSGAYRRLMGIGIFLFLGVGRANDLHHDVGFVRRVDQNVVSPFLKGAAHHVERDIVPANLFEENSLRRSQTVSMTYRRSRGAGSRRRFRWLRLLR